MICGMYSLAVFQVQADHLLHFLNDRAMMPPMRDREICLVQGISQQSYGCRASQVQILTVME